MSLRRSTRATARPVSITAATSEPVNGRKREAETSTSPNPGKKVKKSVGKASEGTSKKPEAPVTPIRKRRAPNKVPPLTPTPSFVNLIRAPYRSDNNDDGTSPPEDRAVEPHVSNATLATPGGTKTTAYGSDLKDADLPQNGLPTPTATTGTLLDKACAHLIEVDTRLKPLVQKWPCPVFSPEGLAEEIIPFRALASGIIGQQISGAAALSIENKFVALFNKGDMAIRRFPSAAEVAVMDIPTLRTAGLSQRKAEYIQGLAEKFVNGDLTNDMLLKASDEEVMERLIAVRGLGKWSVEMFACFGLKRLDILSTGDLGVQRGMAHFFGRDVQKLKAKGGKWKYMSEQDMLDKSAPFAPYRSLFMWYMWRIVDVNVDVMQQT